MTQKTQETLVTFLLDRTGSMMTRKAATIEAFNSYLDGLVGQEGIKFNFLQFDDVSLDKLAVEADPSKVQRLTEDNYQPRAGTNLIDSAVQTIRAVQASLDKKLVDASAQGDASANKPKVVVCIQTDGEENSSRHHTWEELNGLIVEKTAQGWAFNFMGAGIDAYQQAQRMGIGVGNTVSYSDDLASTRSAFAASSRNTMAFASGASSDTQYTSAQKLASGDKFDPGIVHPTPPRPSVTRPKTQHSTGVSGLNLTPKKEEKKLDLTLAEGDGEI